jgi:hypothetical protein
MQIQFFRKNVELRIPFKGERSGPLCGTAESLTHGKGTTHSTGSSDEDYFSG